jgi:hypothetical protein
MANRLLLQTLLRFSDDIKSGAAKVQDVITDYFNATGKSVTDEERSIILKEFQDNAPDNVTTLEGVDPRETIMPMGGASDTPFTNKVREQNPDVEITGRETFGELMDKMRKSPFDEAAMAKNKSDMAKKQGLGSLYPKSETDVDDIFDLKNDKRMEVADFMRAMRAAGIKNEDVMNVAKNPDIAEGKRAATSLARAADMAADTKVKQELLANLDDDIANYGPDWWKGMGYNEGPMGRESVGNLLESITTDINNGVVDDLIARGMDEDKAFDLMRYIGRDRLKYDPKGFITKIVEELEMNNIKYDMTFWDNYVDEILTRIQKPEPRFADGGLV